MEKKELLDVYKSLFDTWRFEVNSHWQRSSYFAAFETVAVAACWKLVRDTKVLSREGIVVSILGLALTVVWFLNNRKTHFYARYWLERVGIVEQKLSMKDESLDFATQILNRPRTDWIKHPHLVQAVPMIFFALWLGLFSEAVWPCLR
jgi:hypothetical protein